MMKTRSTPLLASLALLSGLCFLPPACAQSLDARCSEGACDPRDGAAGLDGNGGDGGDGGDAATDPCLAHPTTPECLDESKALFVSSPNGNDADATGARAKPFKTIGAALAKIDGAKRRIFVCAGTYPEDIALTATHTGVSLFGGVSCDWAAAPGIKPVIGATANPWKIDAATGVAVADVAIEAKDATTGSSIAVFVKGGEVSFKDVRLAAGKGGLGADALVVPYDFVNQQQADLNGNDASASAGAERAVTCPGGAKTTGGKGGAPANSGSAGTPGPPNAGELSNCTSAVGGASAPASSDALGASSPGALEAGGWVPAAGGKANDGKPGQGGGGGYGNAGAGGGGGAGGCGGAGGPGGGGGGASMALAMFDSNVTLRTSTLTAKSGGNGGKGAIGQDGQAIFGFGGTRSGGACNGGNGGLGGKGGAGGGGAGGSSLGIAYAGPKPDSDPATNGKITFGTKAPGGQLAGTNPGVEGLAQAVFESK